MDIDEFLRKLKQEYKNMLIDCNTKKLKSENQTAEAKRKSKWAKLIEHQPFSHNLKMLLAMFSTIGMFASFFLIQTSITAWLLFFIPSLLVGTIAVLDDKFATGGSYSDYEVNRSIKEDQKIEQEQNKINELIKNISVCKDYYNYVLPENLKMKPITIFPRDVSKIPCLPTTILHMFYQGRFDEFLRLSDNDKQKLEQELDLIRIISTEKNAKFGLIPEKEVEQSKYLQNVRMVGQTEHKIDRIHK